ncbi:unnamed protein product [Peniophora sp. CBMAI 1063]|nr:unnamed protein product [Peniophora sp. CBMAI 1063]
MAAKFRPQDFPVGPRPDWELDAKLGKLKSVMESGVLAASLQESRAALLGRLLPQFSDRMRGAAGDNPFSRPHSTNFLGKCILKFGPHIMHDVLIHQVIYTELSPYAVTVQPVLAPPKPHPRGDGAASLPSAPPTNPFPNTNQGLISSIISTAKEDLHLARCIRKAAAGKVAPEEAKYVTATINQLVAADPSVWQLPSRALASASKSSLPCDIIFSFKERPDDQWLLPRHPTFIEREPPSGAQLDLIQVSMSLSAPTAASIAVSSQPPRHVSRHTEVITLQLEQAAQTLYDSLIGWVGGPQQNMENRDTLRDMVCP